MNARNKNTGSRITGIYQTVYAQAGIDPGTFSRRADGTLTHEPGGGSEAYWETADTVMANDEAVYMDERGEQVVASDIELYDDDKTEAAPPTRATNSAEPAQNHA